MGTLLDLTQVASSGGGGGATSWKVPVATFAALPAGTDGDARVVIADATIYVYGSGAWHVIGTAGFSFSSISGYYTDFDIADATSVPGASNGVAQSTVNDKSPTGLILLQSTGAKQPIYHSTGFGPNSKPYLDFNGSTHYMQTTVNYALTGNIDATVFVVCDFGSIAVDQTPFGWGDSSSGGAGYGSYIVSGGKLDASYAGGVNYFTGTAPTTGAQILAWSKAPGAIDTNSVIYKNNSILSIGVGSSAATPNIGTKPFGMGIWADYTATTFTGKIARIIVYSRALTTYEAGQVFTGLNAIYGIY